MLRRVVCSLIFAIVLAILMFMCTFLMSENLTLAIGATAIMATGGFTGMFMGLSIGPILEELS